MISFMTKTDFEILYALRDDAPMPKWTMAVAACYEDLLDWGLIANERKLSGNQTVITDKGKEVLKRYELSTHSLE